MEKIGFVFPFRTKALKAHALLSIVDGMTIYYKYVYVNKFVF